MEDRPEVEQIGTKTGDEVEAVFRRLRAEAERQGEDAFHDLHARHRQRSNGNKRRATTPSRCDGKHSVGSACPKCGSTV